MDQQEVPTDQGPIQPSLPPGWQLEASIYTSAQLMEALNISSNQSLGMQQIWSRDLELTMLSNRSYIY